MTPGEVVGGRFRLEALVGSGGMGFVWRATSLETGEVVALKFVKAEGALDDSAKRRLRREAKAAMAVRHPNVVRITDVITGDDDQPIIVMEFLSGETLQAWLTVHGALDMATFADIFRPVVSAVGAAHAVGVVHRDLKPENIWLVSTPDGKRSPRVLDFGIAKIVGPNATESTAALTTTGGMLGTPRYMAPEQVFGEKDIDHRVDVWSLGVMAYECLSGKRPVPGDNVWQVLRAITTGDIVPLATIAPDVPPAIAKIVMRMLAVDRDERSDDLVELYDALLPYSEVEAAPFPHISVVHAAKSVKRRVRTLIFFAASVAALGGVAAFTRRSHVVEPTRGAVSVAETVQELLHSSATVESTLATADPPSTTVPVQLTAPRPIGSRLPASVSASAIASASASVSASATNPAPQVTVDPFHGLAVDAPF
jgi:serine/threonine-protein kinase